jgi:hypothetical protein
MPNIQATGRATIRLTDTQTGRVDFETTSKNTLNADYAAEAKNSIFTTAPPLNVYLSEYDQPAPANGLIFPLGKFLGYGKYGAVSANQYQGTWAPNFSSINTQMNGLTSHTLAWDFTDEQAVGTIRSLFLYLDTVVTRYPSVTVPAATWYGSVRWCVENKVLDVAAKTSAYYSVVDLLNKTAVVHSKSNTLTLTGISRDVDNGHIFVFDSATRKLYEFADIDTDLTTANMLNTYNCTTAYPGKGLVKGDFLYFLSGNVDPLNAAAVSPTGANIYLFKYAHKTNAAPVLLETLEASTIGAAQFTSGDLCSFVDDALVCLNTTSGTGLHCPLLRIVGGVPHLGFIGGYSSTSNQAIMRVSPGKQVMVCGSVLNATTYPLNKIPPMPLSQLLLPEPIIKDNSHRLSITYTISIQD